MNTTQKAIARAIRYAIKDSREQFKQAKRKSMYGEMATSRAYENGLQVALQIVKAVGEMPSEKKERIAVIAKRNESADQRDDDEMIFQQHR